jgi:hypothetical protein
LPAQFQCRRRECKGDIGELRENETHLIPRAMTRDCDIYQRQHLIAAIESEG